MNPCDWLNTFNSFYMAAIVGIDNRPVGMTFKLKCVIETNLIRVCFSYKGRCDVHGCCMHTEGFKKELAWAADKRLLVISKIKPFKFYIQSYVVLSKVF